MVPKPESACSTQPRPRGAASASSIGGPQQRRCRYQAFCAGSGILRCCVGQNCTPVAGDVQPRGGFGCTRVQVPRLGRGQSKACAWVPGRQPPRRCSVGSAGTDDGACNRSAGQRSEGMSYSVQHALWALQWGYKCIPAGYRHANRAEGKGIMKRSTKRPNSTVPQTPKNSWRGAVGSGATDHLHTSHSTFPTSDVAHASGVGDLDTSVRMM